MPYKWNQFNRPKKRERADHQGAHRTEYEKNRLIILRSQEVCAYCGQVVDKSLKFPHPLSASVDHIIPISKGGHPSALNNLQLMHLNCNRIKWNKLPTPTQSTEVINNNRDLPQSMDWTKYRGSDD